MRFIHVSDLHLGKKLNEASLLEDQRHMLGQLLSVLDAEKPDALLVAGDVYDRPVPPAEAVALLDEFLTGVAARGVPVALISGNHDSAERLAFGARLLSARQVYLSPVLDRAHAAIQPLTFTDEFGKVCLWMVPFVKPAHVRAALPEAAVESYTDALRAVIATLPLDPQKRNVLVCHQFLTGGERSESEEISVGGLDNVDAGVFAGFDYVAAGHLHRAQSVGLPTVRYCGSPLKYSFAEANDQKSVTLVTLGAKGDVQTRQIPITPLRELRKLRGAYAELTLRANYQHTAVDDYLHITLTDAFDVPDALAKLQVIYPNLLRLEYDNARTRQSTQAEGENGGERRTPLTMLADFYALQNNQPMSEEQHRYALTLMERIWEGGL